MLRKCEKGSLQIESAVLLLCVALGGIAGLRTLGVSMHNAIGAETSGAAHAPRGPVTSAQAGITETLARWSESASHVADAALETTFRGLAKRSGGRVFHDNGALYEARLELSSAGNALFGWAPGSTVDGAFVRVSRGTGRAAEKPTVLGLAVQVPNAQGGVENMLMVSAGEGRVGRRVLRNADGFFGDKVHYSSLIPFRLAGATSGPKYLVLAEPDIRVAGAAGRAITDLEEVNALTEKGQAAFRLSLAAVGDPSKSQEVGRVILSRRLPAGASDAFTFQQWTNASLTPVGLINRIRKAAYTGSQEGSRVTVKTPPVR